jgi:hypothetical protein
MNGSTYHVHDDATTCESSTLLWQVYKSVHGFWICQMEVSIVGFNDLVFSLPNETITFIFLFYLHWIMQKYPMHFQLIRIIIKDAHKENEGSLKIITI